jgi:hypothetical protein
MSRPDPIQYAERLYAAIRDANFSPISFLAFGSAVKDGVALRNMPRIAAEPFMRVVGEMLDLEEVADQDDIIDADVTTASLPAPAPATANAPQETTDPQPPGPPSDATIDGISDAAASVAPVNERRRGTKR